MKVVVKGGQIRKFPKLMIHTDGTIVFFSESEKGVCVKEGGNTRVGFLATTYCMSDFTDFEGTITLSND